MNKLLTMSTVLLLILTINSCELKNQKYETQNQKINNLLSFYAKENNYLGKRIFIITGLDGCNTCMDYTINFMDKHQNNSKMTFIVSGMAKKKMLILLNKNLIQSNNFIFDSTVIALRENLISMQPKVYFYQDNKIVDAKEITSLNADSLFKHVENFIKN